ncbi:related to regulatory protein amdA [Cephalotrichum gorgonifer]|uniref:Related to regulatory protein amdA n=1 Tax=Cephalotrichum gorgonifer TaxID=2041049 RepID=A0AAE8N6C8_9PEZI|nr:related to regulatory protein amdA [Cephalotrichum gorgonifer]
MYASGHPQTHAQPSPNASAPGSNLPNFHQQQTSQPGAKGQSYAMSGPPSYPSPHAFSMPQTSQPMSHPQPIAPAPPGSRGAPVLRPMPGVMNQPGVMPPGGTVMQQAQGLQEGEQPTHVVGSQGRRGILPSAPGRAPVGQVNSKGQVTPVKDADGKFPCPHCTKTYLHAKHLKRHLLRHTGDRPYRCVLCNDTFSRSDILKRHFQKCSIRRGNPAGVTHLSLPQAHVKKSAPAVQKGHPAPVGMEGDLHHLNGGLGNLQGDGMSHGYPMVPVPEGLPNLANDQGQMQQRPNSVNRMESNGSQDRQGGPGSVMGPAPGRPGFEQQYSGNVPGSMQTQQQMQNYNMPTNQNGMPMYQGGSNSNQQVDWSQVFPTGAQDSYANAFPPNVGQTQIPDKQEPNVEHGRADGAHGVLPTDSLFFANYIPPTTQNPYVLLSNQLLSYFQTSPPTVTNQSDQHLVENFFTPDNIKDFLDKYTNYNIHFPLFHIPSVRITEMNTGLLAGLCCVGACYSERVSADHVREVMDVVRGAYEAHFYQLADWRQGNFPTTVSKVECEQIQSVIIMAGLHIWNGNQQQRAWGQGALSLLPGVARSSGLLHVSTESTLYSPLHQKGFSPQNFDVSSFDWAAWVEQEGRVRLVHIILVCDAALSMYFNISSRLDPFEVDIPLPCDDGAWEARTAFDCAAALGLYGPEASRQRSVDGTHRAKQPETSLALRALLHGSYQIQPGRTNLYGKFVLIHAIINLIRNALVDQNAAAAMKDLGTPPLHDWMVRGSDSVGSGRSTPVEGAAQQLPAGARQAFSIALDKFKANWDADMATQFPPSLQDSNPRRYGFSRDAIHFYWLGKYMLKHTRPSDLQLPPDARVSQMLQLLKSVKTWVMTDGASRGEELGSVGDINKDYGVSEGTFNLAQIFAPLPNLVDDPRVPSVKTEIDTGIM